MKDQMDVTEIAATSIAVFVIGSCVIALVSLLSACSQSLKPAEAETVYLAQQLKCVDLYNTRETINACRLRVRNNWSITETVKDGGAP